MLPGDMQGFPCGSVVKNPPAVWGAWIQVPWLGRSPGGRQGNPLQYSCLENLLLLYIFYQFILISIKCLSYDNYNNLLVSIGLKSSLLNLNMRTFLLRLEFSTYIYIYVYIFSSNKLSPPDVILF